MKKIEKPWGYELIWAQTDNYVGKILFIKQGHRLSLQYHEKKEETLLLKSGTAEVEIGTGPEGGHKVILSNAPSLSKNRSLVPSEMVIHIPPGMVHRIKAFSDVEIIEVSTTELDDVVRLEDDYNR